MVNYFFRRGVQLLLSLFLFSIAVFFVTRFFPDWINRITNPHYFRGDPVDRERIRAYLGLDKPFILQYTTWMIGDDWLGADWMYIGLSPYKVQKVDLDGKPIYEMNRKTYEQGPVFETFRFWAEPGMATIEAGDWVRVWGDETEDGVVEADRIVISNRVNILEIGDSGFYGRVYGMTANGFFIRRQVDEQYLRFQIVASEDTEFQLLGGEVYSRGQDDQWVDVSGIFGLGGWLGDYVHLHGKNRGLLRLDYGFSWSLVSYTPLKEITENRINNTFVMMAITAFVSFLLAIPAGIYSAVKDWKGQRSIFKQFNVLSASIPDFWLGMMLILIFYVLFKEWGLPYFPGGGSSEIRSPQPGSILAWLGASPGGLIDQIVHLIFPISILSFRYAINWANIIRGALLKELKREYIRTARAKGLNERIAIGKHAVRNAIIPLASSLLLCLPHLFLGAILVETVFAYPGIGRLYFQAISKNDWPIVSLYLFSAGILAEIALLLRDVVNKMLDPHIKLA